MLENLRGMAVFASIVQHGSFGAAAKELGITTSAVSQQIRSLELDLGVTLLHRSTRKFTLTEAGETLYQSAVQVVEAAERGQNKINELLGEVAGSLRIATSQEVLDRFLIEALSDWLQRHPELSLHFIVRGESLDMIDDRVDFAVVVGDEKDGTVLTEVKDLLLAAPAYLKTYGTPNTPDELMMHQYIASNDEKGQVITLSHQGKTINIKPKVGLSASNEQTALSLARAGYGVVKANELAAKDMLDQGELVPVMTDCKLPKRYLIIQARNKDNLPNKVELCMEIIKDYFWAKKSQ